MTPVLAALVLVAFQDSPPGSFSKTVITAGTDDSYRFDGRRDDGGGDVAVLQTKLSLEALHLRNARDVYRVSGAVERIAYDFDRSREIEDAVAFRTDASWIHVVDPDWTGAVYGALKLEFEPGASVRDALAGAAGAAAWTRVSEDLSLGLILHVRVLIEDSPQVWPLPYVNWKLGERVELHTEQKAGFGYALTVGLDEPREDGSFTWAVDGRMRFQTRRMRHDDHGFNPDGILEDLRFTIDVLARYEPRPGLSFGAYVGVEAWQMYEVEDKRGHGIDGFNTYAKPVVGLQVFWKF